MRYRPRSPRHSIDMLRAEKLRQSPRDLFRSNPLVYQNQTTPVQVSLPLISPFSRAILYRPRSPRHSIHVLRAAEASPEHACAAGISSDPRLQHTNDKQPRSKFPRSYHCDFGIPTARHSSPGLPIPDHMASVFQQRGAPVQVSRT